MLGSGKIQVQNGGTGKGGIGIRYGERGARYGVAGKELLLPFFKNNYIAPVYAGHNQRGIPVKK